MILLLFILCWAAYFITYIGRLNFSSAMTELIATNTISKTQAGTINMIFFFCYGGGQLVNGFLGDRISPRKMVFTGIFLAGCANALMGLAFAPWMMMICWGINGYCQAMVWPPMVRIFSQMLPSESNVKACVNITSTVPMGTLGSYLLSAGMLALGNWRLAFFVPAIILGTVSILWLVLFQKVEKASLEAGALETDVSQASVSDSGKTGEIKGKNAAKQAPSLGKLIALTGLAAVILPVMVHGVLKDGVTSWVPAFISETFSASSVTSILATMVLPIVNLSGAYAASFLMQKLQKETRTAAWFFGLASVSLLCLLLFGRVNMVLTVIFLALITSSMLAVNTIFVNIVPMHYGDIGRSATVSGFLNGMAYTGSAISTFTIGLLVENAGWQITIASWLGVTLLAFVLCAIFHRLTFAPEKALPSSDESDKISKGEFTS